MKLEMYRSIVASSVGDASGENLMKILPQNFNQTAPNFYKAGNVAGHRLSSIQWPWTDDTAMAIGVFRILSRYGTIDQLELAKEFARNAKFDPQRGYGKGTARLLFNYLYDAENWKELSEHAWGVEPFSGSKGNGSAMRDYIIGPYFGRDYHRIVKEARLSAEVTHYNKEAIDGSIAVAIAASYCTYTDNPGDKYFWFYLNLYMPDGVMKQRIQTVAAMPEGTNWQVVGAVGNGSQVTAIDTVPFALWQAHQAFAKKMSFADVMESIIEVGGDTDTVAAMVGGIIGNKIFPSQEEIDRTEPLPTDIEP
jgi:ADP-ribosylglycohydrolase